MASKKTKTTKATRKTGSARTPRYTSASKPGKPVFRTGTWIAVIVLAAVIGAAVYMNRQAEEAANAEPTPSGNEEAFLFESDTVVTGIEVKPAEGETVKLERNAEKLWVLSQPDNVVADPGAAEAAASQVGALNILTEIDGQKDPSIFGLTEPTYTITLSFEDGKTSVLEVGAITPSQTGYYVRVNDDKVYVISLSGIEALTSLSTTPPYLNTPTPVPTATETPLPTVTPEATSTP